MSRAGDVSIDVWAGGSPVWCVVRIQDAEVRIKDTELSDLIYAARKAQEEANEVRRRFNEPLLTIGFP
jgi:hypothetical protein